MIWPRSLGEEKTYFNQKADPNYIPGFTILCYDCHDNHATASGVDNNPPDAWFDSSRLPQDVAFDDDMKTTVPRDGKNDDNIPGYYENIPSRTEGYPVTGPSASTYVSGHFVKNDPGVGTIRQGDKLPCRDCHDPHSTVNQAFIRVNLAGKILSANKASTNMAYDPTTRDDKDSRKICIACHGTSEQATYKAVTFSAVNPSYGATTIAKPPTSISAHLSTAIVACTNCHKHNGIDISCSGCHGFPPLRTYAQAGNHYFDKALYPDVENYPGGAGAHQRHKDALGDAIFACEICHGPDTGSAAWHNEGAGTVTQGNVDIIGQSAYWDPTDTRTSARYTGTSSPVTTPTGYEFTAKGGGNQRCANFACHGDPPDNTGDLTWTADMVDGDVLVPAWENPNAGDIRICKWCHDATPSILNVGTPSSPVLTWAPNVMGNGLATTAGFGAEVNGHGVGLIGAVKARYDKDDVNDALGATGAAKDCIVCHDATYQSGAAHRTHFPTIHSAATDPRDAKRLNSAINSGTDNIGASATFPTGPDQACSACHQNGVNTAADGLDVSYHGNSGSGYTPLETVFTRACRQCHEVHGSNWNGTGRNLFMVGKWLDADLDRIADADDGAFVDSNATTPLANITPGGGPANDNPVVFTHTSGTNSFDENDGAYNPANDTDDICATCHAPATGGGAGTGGGSHAGLLNNSIGDQRGQNCILCHDHDFDNNPLTPDAFMPSVSGCEGCHGNPPNAGCDGISGTADDAPNVMGNGTSSTGTGGLGKPAKPFDNGTYGFNVNGHGANGSRIASLTPNRACTDCHDIGNP